jgi:hypothetical protein
METRAVKLIDQSRQVVATAQVADEGTYYGGTIDLSETPASLLAMFEEFEEIVNGQMFAFLDDIQEKISGLPLKVRFEAGHEAYVKDLQVFPSTRDVSFKLAEVQTGSGPAAVEAQP